MHCSVFDSGAINKYFYGNIEAVSVSCIDATLFCWRNVVMLQDLLTTRPDFYRNEETFRERRKVLWQRARQCLISKKSIIFVRLLG